MGKIIAIANQKGGVGKTTTSINLSASLSYLNKTVLLVDMDPQSNSTRGIGFDYALYEKNIYGILTNEHDFKDCIQKTALPKLFIVPGSVDLASFELDYSMGEDRLSYLKKKIESVKDDYDFIIIDCPPSLGLLSLNSLVAADSVLIPMQCEYYSMEGIVMLLNTIRTIQNDANPNISIEGVLLTMCDFRTKFANEVQQDVRKTFKDKVFKTAIPRNIKLIEASSKGKSIIEYDLSASGASAYLKLAKEVIKNVRK